MFGAKTNAVVWYRLLVGLNFMSLWPMYCSEGMMNHVQSSYCEVVEEHIVLGPQQPASVF